MHYMKVSNKKKEGGQENEKIICFDVCFNDFSKCNGNASCDEKVLVTSAAQCASKAKAGCANSRLTVTKYKKVTADYDGTAVEGGKDFCVGHPDFPYAKKAECKG